MPQLIIGDRISWPPNGKGKVKVYEITTIDSTNYELRWKDGTTSVYNIKSLDAQIKNGEVKVNDEIVSESNPSKAGKCKCELDILMCFGCQCGGK